MHDLLHQRVRPFPISVPKGKGKMEPQVLDLHVCARAMQTNRARAIAVMLDGGLQYWLTSATISMLAAQSRVGIRRATSDFTRNTPCPAHAAIQRRTRALGLPTRLCRLPLSTARNHTVRFHARSLHRRADIAQ
jgi:hypothetical protein